MDSSIRNEYKPDAVSRPGDTLLEVLADRGLSQSDLAERMGRPKKTINEVIKAKASITPETALQLERVLGVSAAFWNRLEANYRAFLAQQKDREILEGQVEWLHQFPIGQLVKLGWVQERHDKAEMVEQLLAFFGVASCDQWDSVYTEPQAAFRKSSKFDTDPISLACWLRKGVVDATKEKSAPFDADSFRQILLNARALTVQSPKQSLPTLKEMCASAGVALVFVHQLPKVPVSGATMWHSPSRAIIQLSLRYKMNDQLWFTFFHEAGHILLHGKRQVFLDGDELKREGQEEHEANKFAADMLVPLNAYRRLCQRGRFSKESIKHFANAIGIAPGIVVGRLQHDGALPQTHCNELKLRVDWDEIEPVL